MNRKDLHSSVSVLQSAVQSGTADVTTAAVDVRDWKSVTILAHFGVASTALTATNNLRFRLQHSNTETAGDFVDVPVADILGTESTEAGTLIEFKAAHAAASDHRYGYIGTFRYLRMLIDYRGTHSEARVTGMTMLGGHPNMRPTDDQA